MAVVAVVAVAAVAAVAVLLVVLVVPVHLVAIMVTTLRLRFPCRETNASSVWILRRRMLQYLVVINAFAMHAPYARPPPFAPNVLFASCQLRCGCKYSELAQATIWFLFPAHIAQHIPMPPWCRSPRCSKM